MRDTILIPHDAIQALADGRKQPTKLGRVQPLFTLTEACSILGMSAEKVRGLLKTKRLFGVIHR